MRKIQTFHDVWVNWFEGEENGYNVCHFHEWRKDDWVELLDQVPLLKVSNEFFNYIENNMDDLPPKLLDDVYQKGYLRKNHERIQLDYCFIISDGTEVLVVDTNGTNRPIKKSRMIPRQEALVYEALDYSELSIYEYDRVTKEYGNLNIHPKYLMGLTRKERNLKQLLLMAMDQLKGNESLEEIKYWYGEWFEAKLETDCDNFITLFNNLIKSVYIGWSSKHEKLCEGLVKNSLFLKKLWDIEMEAVAR